MFRHHAGQRGDACGSSAAGSWRVPRRSRRSPRGSRIASRMGVPTLPAAMARRPAACSIALGHAHRGGLAVGAGDGQPFGGLAAFLDRAPARPVRRRPRSGCPASAAAASSGLARASSPGEVMTSCGGLAVDQRQRVGVSGAQQHVGGPDDLQGVGLASGSPRCPAPSTTTTWAPSSIRVSAAEKPDRPMPGHDHAQAGPVGIPSVVRSIQDRCRCSQSHHPFGVEDAQARGHEEPAEDPEPDHHVSPRPSP